MDATLSVSNSTKHDSDFTPSRSNPAYEHTSISWSSSLPSLTSTSSSLTSVSLSSRTSDLELLGGTEDNHEALVATGKRTPRRYHPWTDPSFTWDRSSSRSFSLCSSTPRTRFFMSAKYWKAKLARTTLWDRVVFVLFCICLWILLRALVGAGETAMNGAVDLTVARLDVATVPSQSAPILEQHDASTIPGRAGDVASLPPLVDQQPPPSDANDPPSLSIPLTVPAESARSSNPPFEDPL